MKKVTGIASASQGFLNQFQFEKTSGVYNSNGIELLINPSFGKLNTWLTYTFLNSDYIFPELRPSQFRNNFEIKHSTSLGLSYTLNKFEISTGLNYRTGKPYTETVDVQDDNDIVYGYPNALTLDTYFRLDISAKYNFKLNNRWRANFGLAIWNVTDHTNMINTISRIDESGNISRIDQQALGFTPNFNLRLLYNFNRK